MKRIQLENRSDLKSEIPLEAPYSIFIDPSSACNFKCTFCMNSKIEKPQIMNFEVYKKIIDDLQEFENPIKTIRLYGFGEPLLNKKFPEMVEYAKKSSKVINVDTTTNGSLLTHELSRRIIDAGIDRINISIEGMTSEKYKEFTGRDIVFEDLVENIEYLYKISNGAVIFVKIAGDYLTEDEKTLFFKTFEMISSGCNLENTADCWYDTKIENVNKKVGVYGQPLDNVQICPYPQYSFTIQSDGQISTCFLDWNKKMLIGDVKEKSVKQIWNSEIFKDFQLMMLENRRKEHPICSKCKQLVFGMPVNLDPYKEEILKRISK